MESKNKKKRKLSLSFTTLTHRSSSLYKSIYLRVRPQTS